MVQAMIQISEKANRVINMVKAKYGLKDKSQAIQVMAEQYEEEFLEPVPKPSYVRKIRRLQKKPAIYVGTVAELRKRYEK